MRHFRLLMSLVVVLAAGSMVGCTKYLPHSVGMGGPVDAGATAIGRVDGRSNAYYFLGFGPFGDDSLKAATADALSKKGGDAVVNVTVDRALIAFPHPSYPLYLNVTTEVSGTAVKLKK